MPRTSLESYYHTTFSPLFRPSITSQNIDSEFVEQIIRSGRVSASLGSRQEKALHLACERGDASIVLRLLQNGARSDIEKMTSTKMRPIHFAAKSGSKEVLALLMQYGADVFETDNEGHTALYFAVTSGSVEACQFLVRKKLDVRECSTDGESFLHHAARHDYLDLMRFLLGTAAKNHINAEARYLLPPLSIAIQKDSAGMVRLLIDHGANVMPTDPNKESYLHKAINEGSKEVLTVLLTTRLRDLINREVQTEFHHGGTRIKLKTALSMAIECRLSDIVTLLIQAGADAEQLLEGSSYLYQAAKLGDVSVMAALLDSPAKNHINLGVAPREPGFKYSYDEPSVEGQEAVTPLYIAIKKSLPDMLILLLSNGATLNLAHLEHQSCLQLATFSLMQESFGLCENSTKETFWIVFQHSTDAERRALNEKGKNLQHRLAKKPHLNYILKLCEAGLSDLLMQKDEGELDKSSIPRGASGPANLIRNTPLMIIEGKLSKLLVSSHTTNIQGLFDFDLNDFDASKIQLLVDSLLLSLKKAFYKNLTEENHRAAMQIITLVEEKFSLAEAKKIANSYSDQGLTPLFISAYQGQLALVKRLLVLTDKPNKLLYFSKKLEKHVCRTQQSVTLNRARFLLTPFAISILNRHLEVAAVLFEAGIEPNQTCFSVSDVLITQLNSQIVKHMPLGEQIKAFFSPMSLSDHAPVSLFCALVEWGDLSVTKYTAQKKPTVQAVFDYLLSIGVDLSGLSSSGEPIIFPTISAGDEKAVAWLLAHDVPINVRHNSSTPLIRAVRRASTAMVKQLLDAGARVNGFDEKGYSALRYAISINDPTKVSFLLNMKAKVLAQDFQLAIKQDNPNEINLTIVKDLMRASDPAVYACRDQIDDSSYCHLIYAALKKGDFFIVKALYDADVNMSETAILRQVAWSLSSQKVRASRISLILMLVERYHLLENSEELSVLTEMLKLLVEAGYDINKTGETLDSSFPFYTRRERTVSSPLYWAITKKNEGLVNLLLSLGATLSSLPGSRSPLLQAYHVEKNDRNLLRKLIVIASHSIGDDAFTEDTLDELLAEYLSGCELEEDWFWYKDESDLNEEVEEDGFYHGGDEDDYFHDEEYGYEHYHDGEDDDEYAGDNDDYNEGYGADFAEYSAELPAIEALQNVLMAFAVFTQLYTDIKHLKEAAEINLEGVWNYRHSFLFVFNCLLQGRFLLGTDPDVPDKMIGIILCALKEEDMDLYERCNFILASNVMGFDCGMREKMFLCARYAIAAGAEQDASLLKAQALGFLLNQDRLVHDMSDLDINLQNFDQFIQVVRDIFPDEQKPLVSVGRSPSALFGAAENATPGDSLSKTKRLSLSESRLVSLKY